MYQFSFDSVPGKVSNLTALLQYRALHQPDRRAFLFLDDGEREAASLTYDQLHRAARAVGSRLAAAGATGERVLLVFQPGLDYLVAFYGCLYAGAIAVPVYPPDPSRLERSLLRLRTVVEDARPAVGVTTAPLLQMAQAFLGAEPLFQSIRWATTDDLGRDEGVAWQEPEIGSETLAFIQYTSGSTGTPKGVMVSHRNILHNAHMISRAGDFTGSTVSVTWLPNFHDLGLINGLVVPLYAGFPSILMSPVAFLQRPLRWLEAITRYRATHSGGPNFAFDLCARKVTREELERLDLSSWVNAYNGAEPIRRDTLDRFAARFEPCGFRATSYYTVYGLAETTVAVSGGKVGGRGPITLRLDDDMLRQGRVRDATVVTRNVRELVGCGHVWRPDFEVRVVEPESCAPCDPDQVGEIWVQSPSVAQGYWGQPEVTEHAFGAYIAGTGEGPFLRTGDLGFVQDDELFIAGRIKDLIIIRGQNHYPQDIEHTVQASHPTLRPGCGAAFSVEAGGDERLVVVQEVVQRAPDGLEWREVIAAIRAAVASNHELQAYGVVLLETGSIHKTSSGKIQRRACRQGFLDEALRVVEQEVLPLATAEEEEALPDRASLLALPADQRQPVLAEAMRRQLARLLKVDPTSVALDTPVTDLGIDSLAIVELRHQVETDLGVEVPFDLLIEGASLEGLAAHVVDHACAGGQ